MILSTYYNAILGIAENVFLHHQKQAGAVGGAPSGRPSEPPGVLDAGALPGVGGVAGGIPPVGPAQPGSLPVAGPSGSGIPLPPPGTIGPSGGVVAGFPQPGLLKRKFGNAFSSCAVLDDIEYRCL